jgi:hypothetical protein
VICRVHRFKTQTEPLPFFESCDLNRVPTSAKLSPNLEVSMQRFLVCLFCWVFLLSGPISAWADCFRHGHGTVEEHHHGAISDLHHGDSGHDHSAPRVHCAQLRFDLQSLAPLSAKSDPKPRDHEYKLTSHSDLIAEQTVLNAQSFSIRNAGRFPRYPFLVGLSPHLLLSVLRI